MNSFLTLRRVVGVLFVLTCLISRSQQILECSDNPLLFFDPINKEFSCIDDSTLVHFYSFKSKTWHKKNLKFYSSDSISKFKREFIPITTSKEVFFVHCSGGEVYHYKNGIIRRIDRSFKHRNKYGSALFSLENQIFQFAGYGLFRTNNTLLKFNYLTKEWIEIGNKGEMPEPRCDFPFYIQKKKLYILGGFYIEGEKTKKMKDAWFFDFLTQKWKYCGEINPFLVSNLLKGRGTLSQIHEYSPIGNYYFSFNFETNTFSAFQNIFDNQNARTIVEPTGKLALVWLASSGNQKFTLQVLPVNQLLRNKVYSGPIFVDKVQSSPRLYWLVGVGCFILVVVLIFFLNKKFNKNLNLNVPTEMLTEKERQILELFLANQDRRLELTRLNAFVDEDGISIDTLKKRREVLLKELRQKLTLVSGLSADEIFIMHQHPLDRRLKIIELNPKFQVGE